MLKTAEDCRVRLSTANRTERGRGLQRSANYVVLRILARTAELIGAYLQRMNSLMEDILTSFIPQTSPFISSPSFASTRSPWLGNIDARSVHQFSYL